MFVDRDDVRLEMQFAPSDTVDAVVRRLLQQWPAVRGLEVVTDPARIRLVCMGLGVLPFNKSLAGASARTARAAPDLTRRIAPCLGAGCSIPVFDVPTPVHVSILPADVAAKRPPPTSGSCCVVQ